MTMSVLFLAAGAMLMALAFVPAFRNVESTGVRSADISELETGDYVCVGGIAREHEPAVVSPLDPDERVLWCHAILTKPGSFASKGPPPTETRKATTWFRLVDEHDPSRYVLIDGNRLMAAHVTLDHDPDGFAQEEEPAGAQANPLIELFDVLAEMMRKHKSMYIKVIRPGDRLWITGRVREGEQGLHFGRWAMIDNVPPDLRRSRQLSSARGMATVAGPVLVVLGLVMLLN